MDMTRLKYICDGGLYSKYYETIIHDVQYPQFKYFFP